MSMTSANEKKRHHHVPIYYLSNWADGKQLWCSGYGKIQPLGLRDAGVENHFYRLHDLSEEDRRHLYMIADRLAHGAKVNKRFIEAFTLPHIARKKLTLLDQALIRPDGKTVADSVHEVGLMISNTAEDYHQAIENQHRKYLRLMLDGDTSFYSDDTQCAEFLYALQLQYTRTKGPRERITQTQGPFENIEGAWNVLHQMIAVTAGASFFSDRHEFRIVLLESPTSVRFITGDQPIINLHANLEMGKPPQRMELYYPLSPARAMLFLEKSSGSFGDHILLTEEQVRSFNDLIAEHAHEQIFGVSKVCLDQVLARQGQR
jgi:hypothetical protein